MFIYEFFFFNDTATTEIYTLSLHDALPILVAGSIFTFALTIGDYITPSIVGAGKQFIGNVVYANVGVANNLPLAAAFATVPVAVMIIYLLIARRLGAFEAM